MVTLWWYDGGLLQERRLLWERGERELPRAQTFETFCMHENHNTLRERSEPKGCRGSPSSQKCLPFIILRAFHSPKQYSWKVWLSNCVELFCCCVIKPQRWINFVNWSSFQGCSNIQGWWASVIKVANQIIGARSRCAERGVSLLLLNSADENLIADRALRMQRQMVHSSCKITTLKEH